MDNINSQGQHKFDWNDISVGNTQLDHSQNFFSKKHYEHERLDEMDFLQQKLFKSEISDSIEMKNEVNIENKENVENTYCAATIDKECEVNIPKMSSTCKSKIKKEECEESPVDPKKNLRVVANVACAWSSKKPTQGTVLKKMPPPPKAYLAKDVYQRNREEAERRRAEEERKLREFHSRPAPKFNHQQQLQKRRVHAITMPVTPQVLKKSRETEEKRRKKVEEWKQKNQPLKFESRPPIVLKEKPFVPEKNPIVVQQCPFNLHMEKRLQERKRYDENMRKALEEKQKQEEEERKRLEEQRIKEIRKATTFKARPNPFKN